MFEKKITEIIIIILIKVLDIKKMEKILVHYKAFIIKWLRENKMKMEIIL